MNTNTTKLVDIYISNDNKNTADNEHIVFKLQEGLFSHGTFVDENHTFWQKNKDAMLSFITLEGILYSTSIMYIDNKIKYCDFKEITDIGNFFKNSSDPCAKIKFLTKLKKEVFACNIKSFSIIFRACMTKENVYPYIKLFLIISNIYEHQQTKYMPKHIAKLRTKLTEKAILRLESC